MIHPANIDAYRHQTGIFSTKVTHALHEVDLRLGELLKAVKDAGIENDTDIFIVSDHGQINITRVIAINALLAERGLITVGADGEVADYVAISKSTGSVRSDLSEASRKQGLITTWPTRSSRRCATTACMASPARIPPRRSWRRKA